MSVESCAINGPGKCKDMCSRYKDRDKSLKPGDSNGRAFGQRLSELSSG
jgi:hypothetical protein